MIGSHRSLAVTIFAAVLLTACSADPVAPSTPFPARPSTVAVDQLDPCEAFDPAQRKSLDLDTGTRSDASVNGVPSKACTWIANNGFGYNVQTISLPAELALTESGATPISVNGFGAARSVLRELTGGAPTCQVTVDAAPGQSIRLQARVVPRPPLPSDDEMCRLATEAASMVMTTVARTAG